jgi:hypothetical protein
MDQWRESNLVRRPRAFNFLHGLLKLAAVCIGFPITVVSLMAWVGSFTESLAIRLGVALVLAIGLPGVIARLLLPKDDPLIAVGLISEIYALVLFGFAVFFVMAFHARSAPLLMREGDREAVELGETVARGAWFLGATQEATSEESPLGERGR